MDKFLDTQTATDSINFTVVTPTLEIAMWVLIGILFVCALMIILFVVPVLIQMKNTLREAEKAAKKVNEDILPSVEGIVKEAGPAVRIVVERVSQAAVTMDNVAKGLVSVASYVPFMLKNPIAKAIGFFSNISKSLSKLGNIKGGN
jgi:phage-related protein